MLNRRSFIRNSIFTAGALSLGVTEMALAADQKSCRWALLSDTHLPADKAEEWRGFSMVRNMEKLIPGVAAAKPDFIGITGDVARLKGLVEDYVTVKEYVGKLSQSAPVVMALGNHDNYKNFKAAFPECSGETMPVKGKHVTVVNSGPMRMIFLDSLMMTNYTGGLLGTAQRKWLVEYLEKQDKRPTVLYFHHTFGDSDGALHDDIRFFDEVLPLRQVKAVVYGHSHVYQFSKQDDLDLINLPSTAYAFGESQPVGWVDATFTATGASFKLNAVDNNTADDGKITEIKWRA